MAGLRGRLIRLERARPAPRPNCWDLAVDLFDRAKRECPPVPVDERFDDWEPTLRRLAALSGAPADELLELGREVLDELRAERGEARPDDARRGRR
jgi:hypothetical protein